MFMFITLGYQLGFEIAVWEMKGFFGLLKWSISPAWWTTNPDGVESMSWLGIQFYRLGFTICTLLGFMAAKVVLLLAPSGPKMVGVQIVPLEDDKPKTVH